MNLLTWNVQWCRGLDGAVDPARIAREIHRLGDFDVICLQELVDNFPAPALEGNTDQDQFAELAALLPEYRLIAGCAVDHPAAADRRDARRRRLGNAILSRLPVGQVFRHTLPRPLDPGVSSMPRMALEAVIATDFGGLRVITTHLEYFSRRQRSAQVEAIRAIYAEGHAYALAKSTSEDGSPFHSHARPAATLICGDFNMPVSDVAYARMLAPLDDAPPLADAWTVLHPGVAQNM
jgi:endonuclease/exonuclease/phosphatase family metal-dependent hydrolase